MFTMDTYEYRIEQVKSSMINYGLMPAAGIDPQSHQPGGHLSTRATRDGDTLLYQELTRTWENGEWVNSELDTYTWDDEARIQAIVNQTWVNSSWRNSFKWESIYNETGLLHQNFYFMWDTLGNAWLDYGRVTFSYDPVTMLPTQALVEIYFEPFGWMNASRTFYTHNEQGLMTELVEDQWSFQYFDWEPHARWYYTYNGENLLSQELRQYWNEGQYQDSDRETYTYNAQGHLIQRLYEYFGITRAWIIGGRTTYSYNAAGLLTIELYEDYINGAWQNSRQDINSYDDNGNLILKLVQLWTGTRAWENAAETTYTYTSIVGVDESLSAMQQVRVYPNPAAVSVNFEIPHGLQGVVTMTIMDLKGAILAQIPVDTGALANNRLNWIIPGNTNNGVYFYRLAASGQVYSGQFLIRR